MIEVKEVTTYSYKYSLKHIIRKNLEADIYSDAYYEVDDVICGEWKVVKREKIK